MYIYIYILASEHVCPSLLNVVLVQVVLVVTQVGTDAARYMQAER